MSKYYYLVASLPYLKLKGEMPITTDFFLDECKKWLSDEDWKMLLSAEVHCQEGRCEDTQVLKEWKEFDLSLREKLAEIREAQKTGEEARVEEFLKSALDQPTPLLKERALAKVRLDFIDEASFGHFFDINWLVLYFLKLQILERLSKFNKDKGEEIFYKLCEVVYEQAER